MTTISVRARSTARDALPGVFVFAIALLLALRFMWFIWHYSVNLLFYDQWDFLRLFFGRDPGVTELFSLQHGPHREGVGLIADKFLYPLTAWNVRIESLMIGGCLVAAMFLALLLTKRLFGRFSYWDAIIPIIFLTLVQWEIIVTPNPSYSGLPLLMMMLYLLALLSNNDFVKYGVVLVANCLLIYTGFGVFMGAVTIGIFAILCYRRSRGFETLAPAKPVAGLLVACASLASFFVHYTFIPSVPCFTFPDRHPENYLWFMALMFGNVTGIRAPVLLVTVIGSVLLVFAIYVLGRQMKRLTGAAPLNPAALVITILLSYSTLFAANTAVGRVCLSLPENAQVSRYATLLFPAFLAMYFYFRGTSVSWMRTMKLTALVLFLVPGHILLSDDPAYYADHKRAWAACYRSTENISYCDALTDFRIYPDAPATGLKEKLDYLKRIHANLFAE